MALDVKGFTSTHLAIIASTGSGKSYLAGVLLEELMMPYNRAAVIIVDPHGEYGTLQEMQNLAPFKEGNYKPRVRIFRPDDVRVRIDSLTIADLRYLLPNLSEKMQYQLSRAYGFAQRSFKGASTPWSNCSMPCARPPKVKKDDERRGFDAEDDPTTGALLWRLNSVLHNSRIFNDFENLGIGRTFASRPVYGAATQRSGSARATSDRGDHVAPRLPGPPRHDQRQGDRGDKNYVPFPVFCLIEEAHNYAPAAADAVSTDVLKTILSEGRKFGVSVGLISQRPGKLDADVLSQCMTQCIMRITNPIDQNRIAESVESVGRDLLKELSSLSKGQVIISGASVNTPVMLRVRSRITKHGGQECASRLGSRFDIS